MDVNDETASLLRLTLVKGLGPTLIGRLLAACGSASMALGAPAAALSNIQGIGRETARRLRDGFEASALAAAEEVSLAQRLGVRVVGITDAEYPPLLRQIPDPPPVLYVKGRLRAAKEDRYPVAIVGSRTCSHYGMEQAERFAGQLAASGLTVVSGGARGIDTAAHRAALRGRGRTIVVLGCGLAEVYPPENADLFDQVAGADGGGDRGAVVSELPLRTAPTPKNFPARNRIISGLSLGVLVVEAGRRSGALITARQAAEEHGREVFAVPGRVDSPGSEGVLDLIKKGGAALVTGPGDVIAGVESAARHHFSGSHAAITADPSREPDGVFDWATLAPARPPPEPSVAGEGAGLNVKQRAILDALIEPRSMDELATATGLDVAGLRAEVTVLEIQRRVKRSGSRLARVR